MTELFTHIDRGGFYRKLGAGLWKAAEGELWVPAVFYEDVNPHSLRFGHVYGTSESRWRDRFRLVNPAKEMAGGASKP